MALPRWVWLALIAPAALVIVVGLVVPMVWLLQFSLVASDTGIPTGAGLTFENYRRVFEGGGDLQVFWRTLRSAGWVTLGAMVLGYPIALWIARAPRTISRLLTVAVLSPLLVSIVVSSYGWLVLLGQHGLVNQLLMGLGIIQSPIKLIYTELAVVIGLTHIVLPFMVLSLLSAIEKIDPRAQEAAAVLGASPLRQFIHIILPLSMPGWISGVVLSFSIAMSAYVTPAVLGPSGPRYVTSMIFNQFVTLFDWGLGAAMAIVLLCVGLVLVFAFLKLAYRLGGVAAGGPT
jgi:putative spermidine/putrescine transport system permease protein